jgi:predicted metalloprotease
MRSLKDSKILSRDSVEFLQKTSPKIHSNPDVASIILLAFKEGANWQLRTSERNYRNKQNKIARFLSDESNMRGAQRP